jgi:hypothetical protein
LDEDYVISLISLPISRCPLTNKISAAFSLHAHYLAIETSLQNAEGIQRATLALQSLARIVIHMTRSTDIGRPLDFDTLAFWSHEIVFRGAMTRLKVGMRDENFEEDLEVCKEYLKLFRPRYGVHGMFQFLIIGKEGVTNERMLNIVREISSRAGRCRDRNESWENRIKI